MQWKDRVEVISLFHLYQERFRGMKNIDLYIKLKNQNNMVEIKIHINS